MRSTGGMFCCGFLGSIRACLGSPVAPSTCPPLTLSGNLIGRPGGGPLAVKTPRNHPRPSSLAKAGRTGSNNACKSKHDRNRTRLCKQSTAHSTDRRGKRKHSATDRRLAKYYFSWCSCCGPVLARLWPSAESRCRPIRSQIGKGRHAQTSYKM
ncbi:hypothetical protein HDV57DRAFT_30751 [Trichoderma longibrachiatum]